jgi:VanZ family protein
LCDFVDSFILMIARSEHLDSETHERKKQPGRFWRYAPLVLWMSIIILGSTGELSSANTSRIIRPLLLWLFPDISEARIQFSHFWVRKTAHFTEYAIFALLAARAFAASSREWLRRGFFYSTLLLVSLLAFSDEFHQSFNPNRTGSIYDSFIDIAGGLTALIIYTLWRKRSQNRLR